MKAILAAAKLALQTGLSAYVRAQDVYVTPSLELIPNGVKTPAIALKDGAIARSEKCGGMWDADFTVQVAVFAQVLKPEASVMSDAATAQKGVLDLAAAVHAILDETTLGIAGMLDAFSPSESASETVGTEAEMFQRKIITYRYLKEETRP
jgi:hypothetical protein